MVTMMSNTKVFNGKRVRLNKASTSKFGGETLTVCNIYMKNGNRCVDLTCENGELKVLGMPEMYLGKVQS